jgi:hypothetical protein
MKRIRSGRGLGDNLYLHCIVRHLTAQGVELEVCTDYPTIFPFEVRFAPWSRERIDIVSHYTHGKTHPGTCQFQDCARLAGVPAAEYRAGWPPRPSALLDSVRDLAAGRPILLVNGARWPMDRADGYGRELLPRQEVFTQALAVLCRHFFTVFIGRGVRVHDVAVDLDLNNATTPDQVMDLATVAAAGFGPCGFMIPLMESFDRPLLAMFTQRGFESRDPFIAQITPQKLLGKKSSTHVIDNWRPERIDLAVESFCRSANGGG